MKFSTHPLPSGWRTKGGHRLDAECLELVLESVRDDLVEVVVAEIRFLRNLVLVASLREVDLLAQALDGLQSRASQRGADAEALAGAVVELDPMILMGGGFPPSARYPVASMARISSGFAVVIVRS
jgi:hypothetical protein